MSRDVQEVQAIILEELQGFAQSRVKWYRDGRSISLRKLLGKDVLMFAARGVITADEFVEESFHALESTSEQGVMGKLWQRTIARISRDTLDTGDLTTVRDDTLWVCELKTQPNTTNSASQTQCLRNLQQRLADARRPRRASAIPVKAAFCVVRGESKDETRVFTPKRAGENEDLRGFEYRYICGEALWVWLTGFRAPHHILQNDVGGLDLSAVREARAECLHRLHGEMAQALGERGLGRSINDVLRLLP